MIPIQRTDLPIHPATFGYKLDLHPLFRLPSASLVYTIDASDEHVTQITASRLTVSDSMGQKSHALAFDDDSIIVRYATNSNAMVSLEALRYATGPADVPEFMNHVLGSAEQHVLEAALRTTMCYWSLIERACALVDERNAAKRGYWMAGDQELPSDLSSCNRDGEQQLAKVW